MNNIKTILSVSVVINVLLLGTFLGYFVRESKMMDEMIYELPPMQKEHKKEPEKYGPLYVKLKEIKQENHETHQQIKAIRHEVFKIMTAPKFDADLYQSKMEKLHALHNEIAETMCCKIKDLAVTLNQDERKKLARFIRKHTPGGRHKQPHPRPKN